LLPTPYPARAKPGRSPGTMAPSVHTVTRARLDTGKEGPSMRRRFHQLPGVLVAIAMLVAMLPTPAASIAASPPELGRQVDGASYQSPQFGYAVDWSSDWAARERDSHSEPGGADRLVLSNNDGLVQIIGEETGPTPAEY